MLGIGAAALLVVVVLPLAFLVWSSVTDEGRVTLDNFRAALSQRLYSSWRSARSRRSTAGSSTGSCAPTTQ